MVGFSGEALSRADLAWLHAEAPTSHFIVTSLAILESPPDVDRLRSMLDRRLELHPRLREVVAEPPLPLAPARWLPARGFDADAHIHRVALPEPRGMGELAAFIGDLAGRPLDFSRPLWELYAVEGPGRGGALVSRLHHSLGDGQAMVRMLVALTDEHRDGWRQSRARRRKRGSSPSHGRGPVGRLFDAVPRAPHIARTAIRGAGTIARLTLLDVDRPTPLTRPLTMLKSVAWTKPIALDTIKQIARMSGTTVNDVVVSAIAGGLGAQLRLAGADTAGLRLRAMVPVNLRAQNDTSTEGNRFSLVFLELPVGVSDPWERLMRVKIEMDRIKASLEPAAGWLLLQVFGFLPAAAEQIATRFYASKASLVLTNVIGPRNARFIAGSKITQMTFWEPEAGGLGVGISIYSYAGDVTVGVISDRNVVSDPGRLTDEIVRAIGDLEAAVRRSLLRPPAAGSRSRAGSAEK